VRREFGVGWFGVGIAEHLIYVVIPLGVLLVRRDMISKFVVLILAPRTDMSLEMM